ncbi:MAG TPA: outer membrane beta-barrel protein [Gemmatimonadaceae bacterium]
MKKFLTLAGIGAMVLAAPLSAQQPAPKVFVEGLGGAVVPTFDIADVVETGGAFGAAIGYRLSRNWVLMGEFDYGMHKDEATSSVDINTLHYIGKLGYSFTGPRERGWEVLVNLGVGGVSFDNEGADETNTYFAINAGAKVSYSFNRSFAVVLSPQGDIAFSKEEELTTNNAWVWPLTAGLRVSF